MRGSRSSRHDVVGFEMRLVDQGLFAAGAGGQHLEDVVDPDAQAADSRTPAARVRVVLGPVGRASALRTKRTRTTTRKNRK
jgi:hypothetical protein